MLLFYKYSCYYTKDEKKFVNFNFFYKKMYKDFSIGYKFVKNGLYCDITDLL